MAEVVVRQAVADDMEDIYEIEHLCFPDPWSRDALLYELTENPRAFYIVAELEGQVVGYAGLWWIGDEGHVTNVAVRPGFRNRHIGQRYDRFHIRRGHLASYSGGEAFQ